MSTDDLRLEPDFSHVHLQWFAEDDAGDGGDGDADDSGTEDGGKDGESDLVELKKTLKQLQKESAGKDRKVSELLDENRKLKGKKDKETDLEKRRANYRDMTQEELTREIERQREELRVEYEQDLKIIKEQNKQNEYIQAIYRVAPEIENLPPFVIKLLTASRESDEDKLREVMAEAKKDIDILIDKNRIVLGNKIKTAHDPKSGDISVSKIPTNREWDKMTSQQKREWAKYATPEQRAKIEYRN